jgi:hypothetical protein
MAKLRIDDQDLAAEIIAVQTQVGAMKPAAAQVDSVAADATTLKTDFNALLAKLRTAGIIAP